ncbi:MAG TPA: hypothetical protein VKR53_00680 [Puia sp.]|nr:hypothetical protein [Puia sp.]
MKETKYIIKKNKLIFLKENIKNISVLTKIEKILQKINKEKNINSSSLQLTQEEAEAVLDELTFLFTLKGVDENSEPNKLGLFIEELIDIFS